jgi:hypothetical protein
MKIKIIFWLLIQTVSTSKITFRANENYGTNENDNFMISAINKIISESFLLKYWNINLIKIRNEEIDQIISRVASTANSRFTIRIEDCHSLKLNRVSNRKKFLVILILDRIESFLDFEKNLNTKTFSRHGFFLIVVLQINFENCNEIFNAFWVKKFFNVNILMRTIDFELQLVTFMPFSDTKCETPITKVINQFDVSRSKWNNTNYYLKKFKDLYRCKITHDTTLSSVIKTPNDGFRGKEIDIINVFGTILNFTTEHRALKNYGNIHRNGSGSGVLMNVFEGKVQMTSGSLQLERATLLSESSSFFSDPLILVIPPTMSYSSIQKLYKTFDVKVWVGIGLVFAIAGFIKTVILRKLKCLSNQKNFIEFVLAMFESFFGGSLTAHQLPRQSYSQVLFATFMLYSLVIRTIYVGILFNYLQNDLKHKEFQNVDEMIEEDFDFYVFESMYGRIVDFNFFNRYKRFEPFFENFKTEMN